MVGMRLGECASPIRSKKKAPTGGTDGLIFFQDDNEAAKKIIVSVKVDKRRLMVKDLIATVEREKAAIGLFVTLAEPTRPMTTEAVSAGFYESPIGKSYPKIQILDDRRLTEPHSPRRFPRPDRRHTNLQKSAEGEKEEWAGGDVFSTD